MSDLIFAVVYNIHWQFDVEFFICACVCVCECAVGDIIAQHFEQV